jgi:hypothetical protein
VTRDHGDIDWFAWIADAPAITAALHADGSQPIPGPPPDQQLDVAKDGEEMSFGWLARGPGGQAAVAGGPYAGEPWSDGMLHWPSDDHEPPRISTTMRAGAKVPCVQPSAIL